MNLFELKKQREHDLAKADSIVRAAKAGRRELTADESMDIDLNMRAVNALNPQIAGIEKDNSIRKMLTNVGGNSVLLVGRRTWRLPSNQECRTWSRNTRMLSTAMFKQAAALTGRFRRPCTKAAKARVGMPSPITVDDQMCPLAPQEMGVRQLAHGHSHCNGHQDSAEGIFRRS